MELPEYVLELRVLAELLPVVDLPFVVRYLDELPLVFTFERPLAAVEESLVLLTVCLV